MRKVILSFIAVAACLAATYAFTSQSTSLRALVSHPEFMTFNQWQYKFSKVYEDETEMITRFGVWLATHHEIQIHNAKKLNYTLGHNQFSDMTVQEFKDRILCHRPESDVPFEDVVLGSGKLEVYTADWVSKGILADIKQQGDCGSCWAFSTVATLEAANAQKNGIVELYSEQEQVDCNSKCSGCIGGQEYLAFQYWKEYGGATSESCYKYTGKVGQCQNSCPRVSPQITAIRRTKGERNLKAAVSKQVVSAAIVADYIKNYESGIFDGFCEGVLDHAVNVVGFGADYWTLRNSWGTGWGENGYFRLAKWYNQCKIGGDISYVEL